MENKIAPSVTIYTPRFPISQADADAVRLMVTDSLNSLAKAVDEYVSANGTTVDGSGEEEIIIITSPPPR